MQNSLFSPYTITISEQNYIQMHNIIKDIESKLPTLFKSNFPTSQAHGVCMGYDFHLTPEGPKLIEINTNAGGLLLNAHYKNDTELMGTVLNMFKNEWILSTRSRPLRSVALIDDDIENQYLKEEFYLFKNLFESNGIACDVVDGEQLTHLNYDIVYNRLTDFKLSEDWHKPILEAYLNDKILLTPSPYHYDLYALKSNFIQLSQEFPDFIPYTCPISDINWEDRKSYFLKPIGGYASKGAYRGDKLTTRVWEEIKASKYLAQRLVPPPEININEMKYKYDLRCYTYNGEIQLIVARVYQGQTTNFRTENGGFAQVKICKT